MESTVSIQTSPRKLVRDLTDEERDRSPVLLDLTAKPIDEQTISFQLTVSFQPIVVGRGIAVRRHYYVGTIGAVASIRAVNGEVVEYTPSAAMPVEHSLEAGEENGQGNKISPEVKVKSLGLKFGQVEDSNKRTRHEITKFSSEEMLLVATDLRDMISWNIDTHRGAKVVRDYLVGSQYLGATFKWMVPGRTGKIQLRPEIRFFGNDKRLLSRRASFMMRFVLWQKGIRLANEDGFDLSFSEGA